MSMALKAWRKVKPRLTQSIRALNTFSMAESASYPKIRFSDW